MKLICFFIFISVNLFSSSLLNDLTDCLSASRINLSSKQFTQERSTIITNNLITKSLLSLSFENDEFSNSINTIFTMRKVNSYCPLSKSVLDSLRNDFLNDRSLFNKHVSKVSGWLNFFEKRSRDDVLYSRYQKILTSLVMKLNMIGIQTSGIIFQETKDKFYQNSTPLDQKQTLDNLIKNLD